MATAYYTVRVETNYGDWMEFEYEYQTDDPDFDPAARLVDQEIYDDVMQNLYLDIDFNRMDA